MNQSVNVKVHSIMCIHKCRVTSLFKHHICREYAKVSTATPHTTVDRSQPNVTVVIYVKTSFVDRQRQLDNRQHTPVPYGIKYIKYALHPFQPTAAVAHGHSHRHMLRQELVPYVVTINSPTISTDALNRSVQHLSFCLVLVLPPSVSRFACTPRDHQSDPTACASCQGA